MEAEPGYVFKLGGRGLGYYRDDYDTLPIEITIAELEEEQRERVKRQRMSHRNELPAFDGSGLG